MREPFPGYLAVYTASRRAFHLSACLLLSSCVPPARADGSPPDAGAQGHEEGGMGPSGAGGSDDLPAPLRNLHVSTLEALTQAISSAVPGDWIDVADGLYATSDWIRIQDKHGSEANPIVISAEHMGGAQIEGQATFELLRSSFVVVRGFVLTASTHAEPDLDPREEYGIPVRSSNHVRITRNVFHLKGTQTARWIYLCEPSNADWNRIDHNVLEGKSTSSPMIHVNGRWNDTQEVARHTRIDHNYFHDIPFTMTNGHEVILAGGSSGGDRPVLGNLTDTYTIVEQNLFEACDGETEMIKNASSSNVYRHNTFRGNRGWLSLRNGNRATVSGNFFLDGENGLRVASGDDHVVVNNYFDGLVNGRIAAAITVGSGTVRDLTEPNTTSRPTYDRPDRVVIAFNTMARNAVDSEIEVGSGDPLFPTAIRIANNLITGDRGVFLSLGGGVSSLPSDAIVEGNLCWPVGTATTGRMPASGFMTADPRLRDDGSGMLHLAGDSPAIDQSVDSGRYDFVGEDMEGQARSEPKDIGADESVASPALYRPLTPRDVGPDAP